MSEPINSTISPWMPEQDQVTLAVLGKLIEECSELSARAARCILQGLGEADPDTGRENRHELERELADVLACINVVSHRLGVYPSMKRVTDKVEGFRRWHEMIEEGGRG